MSDEQELRRQILQLEFQHKKDISEIDARLDRTTQQLDRIAKQLDHITQLTGFAFQELEFTNEKLQDAGEALTRQKQP